MNSILVSTTDHGVGTNEVGPVTGDLTITTTIRDGKTDVTVAYVGAEDTYHVKGSPLDGEVSCAAVVEHLLSDHGTSASGNPKPGTLETFPQ